MSQSSLPDWKEIAFAFCFLSKEFPGSPGLVILFSTPCHQWSPSGVPLKANLTTSDFQMCLELGSSASSGALCQRWSRGMKTEVPGDIFKRLSCDRCLEISQCRKEKRKPQEGLLLNILSILLPYLFASESKHSLFCQHKTTWATLRKPSLPAAKLF